MKPPHKKRIADKAVRKIHKRLDKIFQEEAKLGYIMVGLKN